jgi:hypothetical protein
MDKTGKQPPGPELNCARFSKTIKYVLKRFQEGAELSKLAAKSESRKMTKTNPPQGKNNFDGDSTLWLGCRYFLLSPEQTPHHLLVVDRRPSDNDPKLV